MPQIRDDFENLKAKIARGSGSGLQSTTFVGTTTATTTYPSAANRFYTVRVTTVAGPETEGGAASMTSADVYHNTVAYNIGGSVPPEGTVVVVFSVANRLVFSYG